MKSAVSQVALALLQRPLDAVVLRQLSLELLVETSETRADTLAQLTQRRLELELGLLPLEAPGGPRRHLNTIDGGLLVGLELGELPVDLPARRLRDRVHLGEVVAQRHQQVQRAHTQAVRGHQEVVAGGERRGLILELPE